MKTQEEIEQLAKKYWDKQPYNEDAYFEGYNQCQQDMAQQINSIVLLAKELINSLKKQD